MRKALLLIMMVLFSACSAVKNRDKHAEMVVAVKSGDYDKAIKDVNDDDFYGDRSLLLRYLELGSIHYLKGDYYQALSFFDKGLAIEKQLYTKSISDKLMILLINDTMDRYYGARYEVSMLRFYASLCHYHLYSQGFYEAYTITEKDENDEDSEEVSKKIDRKQLSEEEKRFHLNAARAMVMEWAGLLKTTVAENMGEAVYKDDVLNKVYGAFIHEIYGGAEDRQIALKLYQNALEVLFKNYGIYPTFNRKHKEFRDNFDNFPKMNIDEVKRKYFEPTMAYKALEGFLKSEIKRLDERKEENVKIVVKDSLVASKVVDRFEVNLPFSVFPKVDGDLNSFVRYLIPSGVISFEFPRVEQLPVPNPYKIKIYDKNGKEVSSGDLPVISPISDIAYYAFLDGDFATKAKIITRSLGKHIGAILSAYAIYEADNRSAISLFTASLSYAAAVKSINESERADVRHWGTLAGNVYASSFYLPTGEYILKIFDNGKELHKTNFKIGKNFEIVDINLPIRNTDKKIAPPKERRRFDVPKNYKYIYNENDFKVKKKEVKPIHNPPKNMQIKTLPPPMVKEDKKEFEWKIW